MFSTLPETKFKFWVTFILSSACALNLDRSKILSFGIGLRVYNFLSHNLPVTPNITTFVLLQKFQFNSLPHNNIFFSFSNNVKFFSSSKEKSNIQLLIKWPNVRLVQNESIHSANQTSSRDWSVGSNIFSFFYNVYKILSPQGLLDKNWGVKWKWRNRWHTHR